MHATVFVQTKLERKTSSVHTKRVSLKISLALNEPKGSRKEKGAADGEDEWKFETCRWRCGDKFNKV